MEGWSFTNKLFLKAVGYSLLWHFFWFFSVTITISPNSRRDKAHPKVVSLGQVLDDTIFRTLVENKPQLSETFYRRLSDFSAPMELQVKTMEKQSPGQVVGLPYRQKFWESMRHIIGGEKTSPEYELLSRIKIKYSEDAFFGLEGDAKERQILSRPEEPKPPVGMDASLKGAETQLEFDIAPSGSVGNIETVLSSGNPELDLMWTRYLRRWQFVPLEDDLQAGIPRGKIKFRIGERL